MPGPAFVPSPPGAVTPISGFPTAPNPGGGAVYAVGEQNGPDAEVLIQQFTVPAAATQVLLSFEMFVNDWSGVGPIVDPTGLNPGVVNQHARVDLMLPGFPPFNTGAGVVNNYYIGVDALAPPNPYSPYVIDITPDVIRRFNTSQ